jgi:DNA-binding transcriptional ArsR family regulator
MSLTNPYGDLEITDPKALRALAHPTRLAILERLQRHGPSTATRLAEHVGASPSVVSWHLRHLAGFGLVTDWDGASTKRERGWQAAARGMRFRPGDDPEAHAAARQLEAERFLRYADLPITWLTRDEPRLPARWQRQAGVANTRVVLTAAELRTVEDAIEAVLAPYVTRENSVTREGGARPAGARGVRLLRYVMPEADRP